MKAAPVLLLIFLAMAPARAQEASPAPTPITLTEYSSKLAEFSRFAMRTFPSSYVSITSIKDAGESSPGLKNTQFVKTQTMNVLRELDVFQEATKKAYQQARTTGSDSKPMLSPLSGEQWAQGEQERIAASYNSLMKETELKIARCIGILQRQARMPMGQQFSMAGNDPILSAIDEETARLRKRLKREELKQTYPPVEVTILQVLKNGCTVRISTGKYESKDAYIEGLTGPNVAEDQKYSLSIVPDGVFSYETIFGASRTIEKYKILTVED